MFGIFNAYLVLKIKVGKTADGDMTDLDADKRVEDDEGAAIVNAIPDEKLQ